MEIFRKCTEKNKKKPGITGFFLITSEITPINLHQKQQKSKIQFLQQGR
jgi:hypothetical protein